MTTPYPIVERRPLEPSPKRGLFGRGRQYRLRDELLTPHAHHVLVYRVDGQYVLDTDRLRADEDQVVNATHVSLVDMRRNAPVTVQFDVPSGDAGRFTVYVTFVCTVTDPIAVVRGGIDAQTALWGYVRSHQKISELGLRFSLAQVNDVRRDINAQVIAYTTIKPPMVPGMTVALAGVEVGTPEHLVAKGQTRRTQEMTFELAAEKQGYDHRLRYDQTRNDHSLEHVQEEHRQMLAAQTQRHDQVISAAQARHTQFLEYEQREFDRREFDRTVELIGDNPRRALLAAYASGRIDAAALAGQLRELNERDRDVADALVQRDRDLDLRQLEWEQEERREAIAASRDERRQDREYRRDADERRRADTVRRESWDREDILRRETTTREDDMKRFQMRVDLLKTAAERGQFDMVNLGLDRLYADVIAPAPAAIADAAPQGLAAKAETVDGDDEDGEAQVHEEDD